MEHGILVIVSVAVSGRCRAFTGSLRCSDPGDLLIRCPAGSQPRAHRLQLCHHLETFGQLHDTKLGHEGTSLGFDTNKARRFKRLQRVANGSARTGKLDGKCLWVKLLAGCESAVHNIVFQGLSDLLCVRSCGAPQGFVLQLAAKPLEFNTRRKLSNKFYDIYNKTKYEYNNARRTNHGQTETHLSDRSRSGHLRR